MRVFGVIGVKRRGVNTHDKNAVIWRVGDLTTKEFEGFLADTLRRWKPPFEVLLVLVRFS